IERGVSRAGKRGAREQKQVWVRQPPSPRLWRPRSLPLPVLEGRCRRRDAGGWGRGDSPPRRGKNRGWRPRRNATGKGRSSLFKLLWFLMAVHQRGGAAGNGRWVWVRALGNGLVFHSRGFLGHVRTIKWRRRGVKRNPGPGHLN